MQELTYEANCGRCVHVQRSLDKGTLCGITGQRPDFTGNCARLVIDPQAERDYAIRDARRRRVEQIGDDLGTEEFHTILQEGSLRDGQGHIRWWGIFGGAVVVCGILLRHYYKS